MCQRAADLIFGGRVLFSQGKRVGGCELSEGDGRDRGEVCGGVLIRLGLGLGGCEDEGGYGEEGEEGGSEGEGVEMHWCRF